MIGHILKPKQTEKDKPKGFDDFEVCLGDTMRGERATMGKSLLDVQRELKIKATYIAAIENADPSAFETPGFVAGYVRSYARYLGMDPEWAYGTFCAESNFEIAHGMSAKALSGPGMRVNPSRLKAADTDPFANPSTPFIPRGEAIFSRIEPAAVGSVLVLALLIGGIGYGGWSVLQAVQRVKFAPVEQAPGVTANVDPLVASPDAQAAVLTGPETAVLVGPGGESMDRLYRQPALDAPVLVARDGPIAAINPAMAGVDAPITPMGGERTAMNAGLNAGTAMNAGLNAAMNTGLNAGTGNSRVGKTGEPVIKVVADAIPAITIVATRPAWVKVKSADGSVILEKILNAGEKYQLPITEKPAILRTGYAGAVYFNVGGKTYGPAGKGGSVVKNIALGVSEIKRTFKVADIKRNPVLAKVVAELTTH